MTMNSSSSPTKMRKLALLFAGLLALAWAPIAAQKSVSYQEAVTTTVFDTDVSGAQLLIKSDDFNGTGAASYVTSATGHTKTIVSEIEANGEWHMLLGGQSLRTLWITPDNPINNLQPAAPPANYYSQSVEIYSTCRNQSGAIVPFENLLTENDNCTLGVDFAYGGITYKLMMNQFGVPVDQPAKCPSTGCPATGLATVICNAVSGGKCVNWTITPNTSAPNATVASLFSFTGTSRVPWVYVGQYFNTFRIDVSNP